jgi:hypothetical protein
VPDLDRALRDLFTDENLQLSARPDAVRIVQDGVRRRRRRRTLTVSAALATTVGAAVAAALLVPAALTADGSHHTTPVQPEPQYDVAWVDKPAPAPWSPQPTPPKPPTMDAPRCLAGQLGVDGAQGRRANGAFFTTIQLRNVSSAPCLLVGTPVRVVAQAPGQPDVVATRGLHIASGGVGGDLQPGKLGYLSIESGHNCTARRTDPSNRYTSLSVTLPSDTQLDVPLRLDVQCGLFTGGLGVAVPPPPETPDKRNALQPTIDAPATVIPGQTLVYVLTLTNPTGSAISLHHCPGYAESAQAGLVVARSTFGLACPDSGSIAPGTAVRFEMRLPIPAGAPNGRVLLAWRLLTDGSAPQAFATVDISAV